MAKNIRIIYLYIVSFIALAMIVMGFVATVNAIASYCYPVVYYYGDSYYSDKDDYSYNSDDRYYEELAIETRNEKRESLKEGISYCAVTIVGTCLFTYHWKKIQTERKEGEK